MSRFTSTNSSYSQTLHLNILTRADLYNPQYITSSMGTLNFVAECAKVFIEIRKELVPPEIK